MVSRRFTLLNQRDETVCLAVRAAMMHCRPQPEQHEPEQGAS